MEDTKKVQIFETAPVSKAVMTLAIPTVLSSLVMVIYNLADTWFVGMLNDAVQTSAVTLASPVLLAFNAVNNLFGVGSSSMMSRGLGRKDYETVYRSSAFGFYFSLISGALFSLLVIIFNTQLLNLLGADSTTIEATRGYMKWTVCCGAVPAILNVVMAHMVRAEGSALHASIGTMSGCLLNIILDPIFILPGFLNMGSAGAGLATFLSNCVACLYFFVLLFVKHGKTYVCISPAKFGFRKEIVLGVFAVGIPAAIQNLLNVTGMTVLNNFTSSYGADAVAAMGIAHKVHLVPLYIAMGIGQGIMPLISYNYGSGNFERMKQALVFTFKISVSSMVTVAIIYFFGARTIVSAFIKNSVIVDYGAAFLRRGCLAIPCHCIDFLAVGVFQACGFGRNSLIFAILRKIVLEIPALFILNRLIPLYGLAYAQPVAEFILAVTAIIVLIRMFKKFDTERRVLS